MTIRGTPNRPERPGADPGKPTKEAVARQFGRQSQAYLTSALHAEGSDLGIVLEMLGPTPGMRVLDLATGAGHTALTVAPHVHQVVAADLAPEMIAQTRAHARARGARNVAAVIMDVETLAFRDEAFDAVTCRIAPHHFVDIRRSLAEISRVLRRGGRFVVEDNVAPADPALDEFINRLEKLRDPTHVRAYTEVEWREVLRIAGFHVTETSSHPSVYVVDDWMDRSGLDADGRQAVLEALASAPRGVREFFAIASADGRPVGLTAMKVIIRTQKS